MWHRGVCETVRGDHGSASATRAGQVSQLVSGISVSLVTLPTFCGVIGVTDLIGYARVSITDQNPDLQHDALTPPDARVRHLRCPAALVRGSSPRTFLDAKVVRVVRGRCPGVSMLINASWTGHVGRARRTSRTRPSASGPRGRSDVSRRSSCGTGAVGQVSNAAHLRKARLGSGWDGCREPVPAVPIPTDIATSTTLEVRDGTTDRVHCQQVPAQLAVFAHPRNSP